MKGYIWNRELQWWLLADGGRKRESEYFMLTKERYPFLMPAESTYDCHLVKHFENCSFGSLFLPWPAHHQESINLKILIPNMISVFT